MEVGEGVGIMVMCALDFCRALNERGWPAKILFRLAVGKYAYREYELMEMNINCEYDTHFEYGLEDASYHKKTIEQITKEWK
jgi:hypothetical protein